VRWRLAVGVVGLAWSLTTVAAYLPPVLHRYTHSRTVIGALLAVEGLVALGVPLLVGPLSDRTKTRFGARRPWLVAALLPMVGALAFLSVAGSLAATGAVLALFYIAYYVYETPYRSMYPDRIDQRKLGQAMGAQHLLRGGAIGLALVLGGLLLHVARPLPFALAAGMVLAGGIAVVALTEPEEAESRGDALAPLRIVRENRDVRIFLLANTAWETTFAGMRTFVVLYVVRGLDQPLYVSSAILGAVAGGYLVAAVAVGRFADRLGLTRVILVASVVYGLGLIAGGVPRHWHWSFLGLVFLVAIAAGAVMTLAWGLLYTLMGKEDEGAVAGLATMTKGIGIVVGPLVTGGAIDLLRGVFASTDGYAAMWPVLAVPILAAIPLLLPLRRAEQASRDEGRGGGGRSPSPRGSRRRATDRRARRR
jgi:Na+/melibiose symporter-like transporter